MAANISLELIRSNDLLLNCRHVLIRGPGSFLCLPGVFSHSCAGYGKHIVITPKGEVGVCHGLWPDLINQGIKSYFDITVDYLGKIKEHPTWNEWFARTPFNMPQCWSCFGIGLCGGGCAKNVMLRTGSIWNVDEDICILTKKAVEWVIWKYYDKVVKGKIENIDIPV